MRIFSDDSQPTHSPEHRWTETTWEGKGKLFTVPMHWHRYHDEYLSILEGELDIYCDGIWRRMTPNDGMLVVKRCTVHGFAGIPGVRMVLREACQPDGEYKEAWVPTRSSLSPLPNLGKSLPASAAIMFPLY
ncbi:hypothetical protein SVAN01_09032 [Stagonosporopsis vannaccii]|nr:hypothetical protein SVAN01_09032 [Stagonosporopsis vannaccii]